MRFAILVIAIIIMKWYRVEFSILEALLLALAGFLCLGQDVKRR